MRRGRLSSKGTRVGLQHKAGWLTRRPRGLNKHASPERDHVDPYRHKKNTKESDAKAADTLDSRVGRGWPPGAVPPRILSRETIPFDNREHTQPDGYEPDDVGHNYSLRRLMRRPRTRSAFRGYEQVAGDSPYLDWSRCRAGGSRLARMALSGQSTSRAERGLLAVDSDPERFAICSARWAERWHLPAHCEPYGAELELSSAPGLCKAIEHRQETSDPNQTKFRMRKADKSGTGPSRIVTMIHPMVTSAPMTVSTHWTGPCGRRGLPPSHRSRPFALMFV